MGALCRLRDSMPCDLRQMSITNSSLRVLGTTSKWDLFTTPSNLFSSELPKDCPCLRHQGIQSVGLLLGTISAQEKKAPVEEVPAIPQEGIPRDHATSTLVFIFVVTRVCMGA